MQHLPEPSPVDATAGNGVADPEADRSSDPSHTAASSPPRVAILKTYKLYLGGKFPRSESGRTYPVHSSQDDFLVHAVRASRKDVREAVKSARSAQLSWSNRTAYNRGQILYRIAEMMESRREEFVRELQAMGEVEPRQAYSIDSAQQSALEVDTTIERWIWYAGWCDKFGSVSGSSNPVAGSYFGFTIPEATGVIGIVAPDEAPLLGLVSRLAPALVSGNTAVIAASQRYPLPAIILAEALATSDVPPGVVNILTGLREELVPPLAGHADVNAVDLTGCEPDLRTQAQTLAAQNVMRVVCASKQESNWLGAAAQSPYIIESFCEYKTVWHPKGT